jgi:hypothetical protein
MTGHLWLVGHEAGHTHGSVEEAGAACSRQGYSTVPPPLGLPGRGGTPARREQPDDGLPVRRLASPMDSTRVIFPHPVLVYRENLYRDSKRQCMYGPHLHWKATHERSERYQIFCSPLSK